jgi:environmental stress-induced protein Ves
VRSIEGTGTAQEVVMSPTITALDEIDLDISIAYIALGAARTAFTHCPSGENQRAVDEAESALNRYLDARLAAAR